jgi:ankyrin repeat protein
MRVKNNKLQTTLILAAMYDFRDGLELLIDERINVVDEKGMTALSYASKFGHEKIVMKLLKYGAKVDIPDIYGKTALMYACRNQHLNIVKLLLHYGAFIDATDNDHNTALLLSIKHNLSIIANFLLKNNADIKVSNKKNQTAFIMVVLNCNIGILRIIMKYYPNIGETISHERLLSISNKCHRIRNLLQIKPTF